MFKKHNDEIKIINSLRMVTNGRLKGVVTGKMLKYG